MKNYDYQLTLESLWEKAVTQYKDGQRGANTYFSEDETQWLRENGITPQEIYDFAEDHNNYDSDPDFITFATITNVRRSYFLNQMGGQYTGKTVPPSEYPAKNDAVDGIVWLPRLIEKARTKLRGELDSDTMYDCGGDRKFFKQHDISPSEFLQFVARNFDDGQAIISWVKQRSPAIESVSA
ncbi:MAG: DUF5069 domain-containing protein [Verrucomicrobiota bacterium]